MNAICDVLRCASQYAFFTSRFFRKATEWLIDDMADTKVLVLVEDYPDLRGKVSLMYVHMRNVFYTSQGINVTVLSFRAKNDYCIDGIPVITYQTYVNTSEHYDVLISHAANIKNHYRFLIKYEKRFPKLVFFFHGHEVLKIHSVYSKPYPYLRVSKLKVFLQNQYDSFKLLVWHQYFTKVANKTRFVFVSKWMLNEFLKWTKIPSSIIEGKYSITYNCIGKAFESVQYDPRTPKEYDFVTIRSYLDGSKYCVDIVNELAKKNPQMKFLLIGTGKFFDYYTKADNLVWLDRTMNHSEIIEVMQKARCALMPTRTDAQGLMACEMASTGMPLMTSNLPVCYEVFDEFDNVCFLDNKNLDINLEGLLLQLENGQPYDKNLKYSFCYTSQKEVELIRTIVQTDNR